MKTLGIQIGRGEYLELGGLKRSSSEKTTSKVSMLRETSRIALMSNLKKEKTPLDTALDILQEVDYSALGGQELDSICDLIEEFNFNNKLISFLKSQEIEVFHFQPPIPMDGKVVLKRKKDEKSSNVHFQYGATLELNKVLVNGRYDQSPLEYYSGLNISGEDSVLVFNRQGGCTFLIVTEIEEINGLQVSCIEDLENVDWGVRDDYGKHLHLYIESWNEIIPLGFMDYGIGIPGEDDNDDFGNTSGNTELMALFLNEDKTAFITFDGEGFSPTKQVKYSKTGIGENIQRLV